MLETEYVRNCNCNYERIHLEQKPQEHRYQYCILNRGGIRYLLPGSLRYMNGEAYLYYDISSTQNVLQLFAQRAVGRDWVKDFLWGVKQMQRELDRFLLEEKSIIWCPEHIFQDLEKNDFFFLYVPYYEEENGLVEFMDFLVGHIDYADELLVEFVYAAYEQIKMVGLEYLRKQIHEDWEAMERKQRAEKEVASEPVGTYEEAVHKIAESVEQTLPKKNVKFFWEGRRKRVKEKEDYREKMRQRLLGTGQYGQYAVCEESIYAQESEAEIKEEFPERSDVYEEEYGKTIYIEETGTQKEPALYKMDGELVIKLEQFPFVIGKKKETVDLALNDYSVSRVHARITQENGFYYIEDLNSTNGTFKNGLRLQPYEKRKLEKEDELKFGKTEYIYR